MHRLIAWLTVNEVSTTLFGPSQQDPPYRHDPPRLSDPPRPTAPPYPKIQPLDLALSSADGYDLALATAHQIAGWRIVAESRQEGWLEAEARTPLLRFVDDIRIWIEALDGGGCRVHMRSRSRVGRGDFGANARRIKTFLRLVGERAESGPHFPPPG